MVVHWTDIPSFNFDATKGNWKQGEAGFGYADNDDKTILNDMVNEYQSVFIRKEFTIQKEMDLSRLMLAINFDDSFALHLNGRYIFSINIVSFNFLHFLGGRCWQAVFFIFRKETSLRTAF